MANALQKYQAGRLQGWLTFLAAGTNPGCSGGLLGEWGIPQADPRTSPDPVYVSDVPQWQALADYLWTTQIEAWNASHAPGKTLWVTTWASGPQWGFYNLAEGTNSVTYSSTGTNINLWAAPGMLDVREAHPAQRSGVQYGTNVAGLEFGVDAPTFDNVRTQTFGTNWFAPTAGDAAALAARNVRVVRLPIAWERVQPTLLGALDSTYLSYITTFIDACSANNIAVVLDVHNYARYSYSTGSGTKAKLALTLAPGMSTALDANGEGRIGAEYFRDLWRRLSAAVKGKPAILAGGYDLCNEPHDLPTTSTAAYGVIGTSDGTTRQQAKDNGATHVVIQGIWETLQPGGAGAALDATAVSTLTAAISDARTRGLAVIFEAAIHYPPTWAQSAIVPFKKQDGSTWTSTNSNGDNVRDWIWTQTGRNYVADYLAKVLAAVDQTKIAAIRIGGGIFGELQYPPEGSAAPWNYWGYGAAPQSGTDLASDQVQCPAAVRSPFVPFASGTSSSDNTTWTNWWLQGIQTFMLWLVQQHKKAGYGGLKYVLHPSWGLRTGWSQANTEAQRAVAKGVDCKGQVNAYANDWETFPWCTWIDATGDTTEAGKPPWQKLYDESNARQRTLIWGENTGGQTTADMGRVFGGSGAIGYGYRGVTWFNQTYLTAGGTNASYADFAANIAAAGSGAFTGTTMYSWATTTQGWTGAGGTLSYDSATGHTANGSLKQVYSGTAVTNLGADDGGQKLNDPGIGNVLSFWVFLDGAAPAGTYGGKAQWQNNTFTYIDPTSVAYYDASGNPIASLTRGAWCEVRSTYASIAAPNAYRIQVNCPSTTALTFWVDDFKRGSTAASTTIDGATSWEIITQGTLTAIRGNGDTSCVIASGESWNVGGFPHAAPWLLEPTTGNGSHRYTTHLYFDLDDSGDYLTGSETFSASRTQAIAAGYTDDADVTGPTISNVQVTPTATGATITYTTNETAYHGRANYRTVAQATWFGTTVWDGGSGTTHTLLPSGLASNTAYTTQLRTTDLAGNAATPVTVSFTTAAAHPGRWTSSLPGTYAPALWLKLNEASGTTATDSSGNARNGTISATGVTYNQPGLVTTAADGAMGFAATDGYVVVPNLSTVLSGKSCALFAWVTFPADPGFFSSPFGIRGAGDQGFYVLRETGATANTLDLHFKATPTGTDLGTQLTITPGIPQWIGLVYRRDRGVLGAYLNGKLVAMNRNAAAANATLTTGLRLQVGRTDTGADNGSNGQSIWSGGCVVDEVLAFDRAPTNIEVWDLYQAGLDQASTRNTFALLDSSRWFGMHLSGNYEEYSANTTLDATNADLAVPVQIAHTFRSWGDSDLSLRAEGLASMRGAIPMVTLEPWNSANGVSQPTYSLANIIAGTFDTLLRQYAQEAAAYGGELLLRFAHEMNGNWYPWCPGVNGNATGGAQYVSAWQHVYDTFMGQLTAAQQARVRWMWCPNDEGTGTPPTGWTTLASLYPSGTSPVTGRGYVDYLALDSYNWGTDDLVAHPEGWRTAAQCFGSYAKLTALDPNKLILVGETGSSENGGSKAAWITDLFQTFVLTNCPRLRGVVWFNLNKERDWRYTSSTGARSAFIGAVTPGTVFYAPQIRNPQVVQLTQTSAQVTWGSDVPGDGTVRYGTSTAYGQTVVDATKATNHTVSLNNLTPGVGYHVQIVSST